MSDLEAYLHILDSSAEAERLYAAEDIGFLNDAEAVPALLARLPKESSRAVRDAMFQSLTRIDAGAAMEGCVGLLESEDAQIRNQAVKVLRHKGVASIPLLTSAMRQGDKDVRKLVLDVLSGFAADGAEVIYEMALADPDANVVITAVENLGRMQCGLFQGRIESLLFTADHPMLAAACLESLAGIGHEFSIAAIRQRFPDLAALPDFLLVPCLKAEASFGDEREFAEIAGLLATRKARFHPAILGALGAIGHRHPQAVQSAGAVPALIAVAEGRGAPLCRYEAVRILGALSSRSDVLSFLIGCLANAESMVRLAAVEALRRAEQPGLQELLNSVAKKETDQEVLQAFHC
jgi:HEAT repeat protein